MERRRIGIERYLTWAYQREMVDVLERSARGLWDGEGGGAREPSGASACGCAAVERAHLLGGIIRGSGLAGLGAPPEAPGDARLLHAAVVALGRPLSGLVIGHARLGTRPNARLDEHPSFHPRLDAGGRVRVIWTRAPGQRHQPHSCEVDCLPPPGELVAAREEYRAWWDALALLRRCMALRAARLTRWVVTEEMPPAPLDAPDWLRRAAKAYSISASVPARAA